MARILVIEDDSEISLLLKLSLEKSYDVEIAKDAGTAMFDFVRHIEDLILLDLGLPDMDGQELLKKIRTFNLSIPIIVLSARTSDEDKVAALDNGADDYVTKPFSVPELEARIRYQLKRKKAAANAKGGVFLNGPLAIDESAHRVALNGNEVKLTNYEYKILVLLARNLGKTLTHRYIVSSIWGEEDGTGSLRVFMSNLRKKIEADPFNPKLIRTDAGVGYRMVNLNHNAK